MVLCFFLRGFRALAELPRNIHLFTAWLCPPAGPKVAPHGHIPSLELGGDSQLSPAVLDTAAAGDGHGEGFLSPSRCTKIHQTASGSISKL